MPLLSWSHVGVCCSDLERSTRFYEQVLGFHQVFTMEIGNEVAATMEVEGRFLSRMMKRDDLRLELLQWLSLDATGDGQRRDMRALGLTHLAFRVTSVEELFEVVERAGGTAYPATRSTLPGGVELAYVTDPDGVRIELMVGTPDFSA